MSRLARPLSKANASPDADAPARRRNRVKELYLRLRTTAHPIEPARLEFAVRAKRPVALSFALLLFILGFSLDDLHVLRAPSYIVGGAAALLVFVAGPLVMGRGMALRHRDEPLADFEARVARQRRVALLGLLGVALLGVAWLVVFSEGVPPWALSGA